VAVSASPAHCWLCFSLFSLSCFSFQISRYSSSLSCSPLAQLLTVQPLVAVQLSRRSPGLSCSLLALLLSVQPLLFFCPAFQLAVSASSAQKWLYLSLFSLWLLSSFPGGCFTLFCSLLALLLTVQPLVAVQL
jgi:hypothetical protein